MAWVVETQGVAVDRELNALPADMRAHLARICELIEEFGLEAIGRPHIRQVRGALWEIRFRGGSGHARALYVVVRNQRVVIVRVFRKKSKRTPQREIKMALRRAKEVLP